MSGNFSSVAFLTHGPAAEVADALGSVHPQGIDTRDLTAALVNALTRIHALERHVAAAHERSTELATRVAALENKTSPCDRCDCVGECMAR